VSTSLRPLRGRTPWPSVGSPDDPREDLAPRQLVPYVCDRGHTFEVCFAAGIKVPDGWQCKCGKPAGLAAAPEAAPTEHERRMTQLLGRRSRAEGEQILADRLSEMRAR
jgi:RNA polymerase-binding protein